MKLVLFTLAKQTFAIDVRQVREVIRTVNVVPIPDVPPWIEGVIYLRGVVVTLLNLHEKLHITNTHNTKTGRVIVSHTGHCRFGIMVDDVTGVMTLPDSAINPPDDVIRHAVSVSAVALIDEQLVPILDLDCLLTPDETRRIPAAGTRETVPATREEPVLVLSEDREVSA